MVLEIEVDELFGRCRLPQLARGRLSVFEH